MGPGAVLSPATTPEDFARRARGLRWILSDVDGVLTDGRMRYGPRGEEVKVFHARDGLALKLARRAGLGVGLLSARSAKAVEVRARELGLDAVLLGQRDKGASFTAFLEERSLSAAQVAFFGDDLPDLPVLTRCGLALCPADAAPEVRAHCHRVLATPGGQGAVREAVVEILRARGAWDDAVAGYLG